MNSTNFNWGDNIIDSRDIINYYDELCDVKETYESVIEEVEERLATAEYDYKISRVLYECDDTERERFENHQTLYENIQLELENAQKELDEFNHDEFKLLEDIINQGENSPDWSYGETLIHENYFTAYIEEVIHDCYEMPKEFDGGKWPFNHMSMDWEAAAEEALQDYNTIDADGEAYYIRV